MEDKKYIVKQHEENTWLIINDENGEVVNIITKDDIVECCEYSYEDYGDSILDLVCHVRSEIIYNLDYHGLNHHCEEFDKFSAWFDYICIEYFARKIVAYYKQRLVDFE